MSEKRMNMVEYLRALPDMDPEVAEEELKKFSKVDRINIMQTVYIAFDIYPHKRFNSDLAKLCLKVEGRKYYPVIWTPDALDLKWMSKLPSRHLHCTSENRTYTLLG